MITGKPALPLQPYKVLLALFYSWRAEKLREFPSTTQLVSVKAAMEPLIIWLVILFSLQSYIELIVLTHWGSM